jgi:hypothetical protein
MNDGFLWEGGEIEMICLVMFVGRIIWGMILNINKEGHKSLKESL